MSTPVERQVSGLSYLMRDGGVGLPLVLLHGIGSNAGSFASLIEALDARQAVLAWNAPGYGTSTPLAADWPDAGDYAAALMRLLDALTISRCVLVGHSLGCLIAARTVLTSPRTVAALVLVSPAIGYGSGKGAPLPEGVGRRIEELDRLGPEKFAAARAAGLVADPAARPDVLQSVTRAMAAIRRPGYDQAARLLAGGQLLDDAAKTEAPTTVIVGGQDRITPPANARRVFDVLRGDLRVYREIDGAGHAVCQEEPVAIARLLSEIVANKAAAHA